MGTKAARLQEARLLRGIHGRTPASVLAYWDWQRSSPGCGGYGDEFGRVLGYLIGQPERVASVLSVVLKSIPVRQAIPFLQSCIQAEIWFGDAKQVQVRKDRSRLAALRGEIASQARTLAASVDELRELSERSGIDAYPLSLTHPPEAILYAGRENPLFELGVMDRLAGLSGDAHRLKWWPDMPQLLRAQAQALEAHSMGFNEEEAAQAVRLSGDPGLKGVIRVIFGYMAGEPAASGTSDQGDLPVSWGAVKLSDGELATLVNLMRDNRGKLATAENVRNVRRGK